VVVESAEQQYRGIPARDGWRHPKDERNATASAQNGHLGLLDLNRPKKYRENLIESGFVRTMSIGQKE
jgi:hypothetical protein